MSRIWGGGFLDQAGVLDFAGGIVIHTSAGASALVLALSKCGVVWCGVVWCGVVWYGDCWLKQKQQRLLSMSVV